VKQFAATQQKLYRLTMLITDSGRLRSVTDLAKLRPLIDQTCFKFISVSYFVVCCFQHRIFDITKLLDYVAPSVELMMQM